MGPEDPSQYAGLSQEEEVVDWLHDCYFSAVGGDMPSFEAWPTHESKSYFPLITSSFYNNLNNTVYRISSP